MIIVTQSGGPSIRTFCLKPDEIALNMGCR